MNIQVFNAALLAGWFFLTLGGILMNPSAGLLIGGVAVIALTVFIALRFGVYEAKPEEAKQPGSGAG